jgi:alkanesulfonate monooxygenase SsuD/methylene tetrahydromethanopterin reductase-like flavin-dependent oxidoreductase (luciferase family)
LRAGRWSRRSRRRPRVGRPGRLVAEHADVWNIAGVDVDDAKTPGGLLDRYCAEIGRGPASITRSFHVPVSYDAPASTRDAIGAAIDAGFTHMVLNLSTPYAAGVARWVADRRPFVDRRANSEAGF